MSDLLNRREFLFYGSATLAGLTLGQVGRRQLARADARAAAWRGAGVETWATSVCRECPAACGVRVRLVDGVPVKLEGNPLCPVSRGRLCARGQAALESYFDPDRIVGPALRIRLRGRERWEPITWDAAVARLVAHLRRAPSGEVLALAAEEHGPLADAWAGFWASAGATVAWAPMPTARRLREPLRHLTGATGDPMFDIERASHVLSLGAPLVEDWLSPVWAQRTYSRFRRGPGRARGRLVQVEARHSLTARKSDEWIALEPRHHATLAYGLASVLLREGRTNTAFLESARGNLDALASVVGGGYTPDLVASRTGVPVVTILRLARELASAPQPVVIAAADAPLEVIDASFALNALLGALDRVGGVFAVGAGEGGGDPRDAGDVLRAIAGGQPVPRIVLLRDAAALRAPDVPPDTRAALRECELVVSFSSYADEAAEAADLLLPTHTWLESWHAVLPAPADASEKVALTRPAVSPRLDTRDLASVLRMTADRLSGSVAIRPSFRSAEDIVGGEIDRLRRLRRGGPYAGRFAVEWLQQLETGGWWLPAAESRDGFAGVVLDAGGWLDPYFAPGQIRESIARSGGLRFALPAPMTAEQPLGHDAATTDPRAPSPACRVYLFTPAAISLSGSPNQPVLFELLGQPESTPWRAWVEIGPETARDFAVTHGTLVRVEAPEGSVEAAAIVVEGMPAGVAALSYLPAVAESGRWARLLDADGRRLWGRSAARGFRVVRLQAF